MNFKLPQLGFLCDNIQDGRNFLSGKVIARAVRVHMIVDATLNALILVNVMDTRLPREPDIQEQHRTDEQDTAEAATTETDDPPDAVENPDLHEAAVLYDKLRDGTISTDEVCMSDVLKRINDLLGRYKESQKAASKTSALWVQYMDMVDILRKYIRAERTGNWSLHLQVIQEMLPYLAASSHTLYTKSAKVYMQQMSNLQTEHPNVLKHLEEGFHVVRRSERLWAGSLLT